MLWTCGKPPAPWKHRTSDLLHRESDPCGWSQRIGFSMQGMSTYGPIPHDSQHVLHWATPAAAPAYLVKDFPNFCLKAETVHLDSLPPRPTVFPAALCSCPIQLTVLNSSRGLPCCLHPAEGSRLNELLIADSCFIDYSMRHKLLRWLPGSCVTVVGLASRPSPFVF